MKKLIVLFLLVFSMFGQTLNGSFEIENTKHSVHALREDAKAVTVYITRTGAKYHRSSCRYLKKSKISITKSSAISQGYTACKVCKP